MEGVAPDVQLATIGASGTDQDYYRSVAVGYHQALAAGSSGSKLSRQAVTRVLID